jgi:hypothetical protein
MRKISGSDIDDSVYTLNKILQTCKANDIKATVFITPHNYSWINKFKVDAYLDYLKAIASVTDFWDFSGYNTITLNNYNYYEGSHYLSRVSKLMAGRIFNDRTVNIPKDFGYHLNLNNINDYIQYKKSEIAAYEERFALQ